MTIIQAIILGITEGATEFLPISSSGHLIIVRQLLHLQLTHTLAYDAVLQFASALALCVYFRKEIKELILTFFDYISRKPIYDSKKTLLWAIIFGTIPAVIFGLLLQSYIDSIFRNIKLVGLMLFLGSILIYYAQKYNERKTRAKTGGDEPLTVKKGIIVGFYQCLALIPGVSRSGVTISGGLLSNLSREEAVRFSFLLSIPILLGSGAKELFSARHDLISAGLPQLIFGSLASFIVALLAIHYFIRFLKNHNLNIFIWYRIALFITIFLWL